MRALWSLYCSIEVWRVCPQIGASHTCLNTRTHDMWRRGQEDLIMVFLTIVQMSYFSVQLVFMMEKAKKCFATLGQLIRPMIPLTRERPGQSETYRA